jgi:hypothetical protein
VEHADKTRPSPLQRGADPQRTAAPEAAAAFSGNHAEAIAQRQLIGAIERSPRVAQQRVLSAGIRDNSRRVAQRQQLRRLFGQAAQLATGVVQRRTVSDVNEGRSLLKEWSKLPPNYPTEQESPAQYARRFGEAMAAKDLPLSLQVMMDLGPYAQIVKEAAAQGHYEMWITLNPPKEGHSKLTYYLDFLYSIALPTLFTAQAYQKASGVKVDVVKKAAASAKLAAWSLGKPRTKDISAYLLDFTTSLRDASREVLTNEALAELKDQHSTREAGPRVDAFLANSLLLANTLQAKIRGGTVATGHIHLHSVAEYVVALGNYVVGKPKRDGPGNYTLADAPALAADVPAFADGTELHFDAARADIHAVLHETMHKFHDGGFVAAAGWMVKEGMTEYFTRRVAAEQGIVPHVAYPDEVASVERLVALVGVAAVGQAFFAGQGAQLKAAVDLAKGNGTYDRWVALMQQKKPTDAAALL